MGAVMGAENRPEQGNREPLPGSTGGRAERQDGASNAAPRHEDVEPPDAIRARLVARWRETAANPNTLPAQATLLLAWADEYEALLPRPKVKGRR